ncbi:MAG: hypothetical protein ACRDRX_18425 [Pseudonocardiaceae bacterium]
MRIFNRVVAAGTLAVSVALGASGVAVAGVAVGSPVSPTQIGTPDDDGSHECDNKDNKDGGILGILGSGDRSHEVECGEYGNKLPG